jgi:hypothetical protein
MGHVGKWEARIVVPTGGWVDAGNFTLSEDAGGGAQDVTITAGNYWWSSGDGGNDFAAQLKADLETASFNTLTYTVTVSAGAGGTGLITMTVSSGVSTITWGSSDGATVRDLCGYAGATTVLSGVDQDGSSQVQGLWLPGCPVETPGGLDSSGVPVSAGFRTLAEDGTYLATHGSKMVTNEYTHEAVAVARTIAASESTSNESYEQFWLDAIRGEKAWAKAGRQLRFYKDADVDGTYKTHNVLNVRKPDIARRQADFDGFWRVRIEVVEN